MTWRRNPEEPEKIIYAAIHYDDGNDYGSQPDNISGGFVIGSRRHDASIGILHGLGFDLSSYYRTEGFITTYNRFLDRNDAGTVAYNAGQIEENTNCLFSEDLY